MLEKNDLDSNLLRVHEWIKAADQKVSIFLAFQGIALTIILSTIYDWMSSSLINSSCANLAILAGSFVLFGFSIYKSISSIIPRLSKDSNSKSIIYFWDISQLELSDFRKRIKEINSEEYEDELINQIYISSKIASRKHSQFREAILIFCMSIVLLLISFLIFYV